MGQRARTRAEGRGRKSVASFHSVINNNGTIEANSIGMKNGMIVRARRPAPASP
jgi:hypothetical protein